MCAANGNACPAAISRCARRTSPTFGRSAWTAVAVQPASACPSSESSATAGLGDDERRLELGQQRRPVVELVRRVGEHDVDVEAAAPAQRVACDDAAAVARAQCARCCRAACARRCGRARRTCSGRPRATAPRCRAHPCRRTGRRHARRGRGRGSDALKTASRTLSVVGRVSTPWRRLDPATTQLPCHHAHACRLRIVRRWQYWRCARNPIHRSPASTAGAGRSC